MMSLAKALSDAAWLLQYRRENPGRFESASRYYDSDEQRWWDSVIQALLTSDRDDAAILLGKMDLMQPWRKSAQARLAKIKAVAQ